MKLPGVISLRNDLPIWAIPNGGFLRVVVCTFLKFTKMPCAVSGRRYATDASSSTGPTNVLNIRLKLRASVKLSLAPQLGHAPDAGRWSARNRSWQLRQSTSGSVNVAEVPARLPHLGGHENGGVEADDVVAVLHHRAPPRVLHVALEQHPERPVIPGGTEPAVDLGRREDQPAPLGEIDHAVHEFRISGRGHSGPDYRSPSRSNRRVLGAQSRTVERMRRST